MSEWTHGYTKSAGYTYGFFRELAPAHLDFCAGLSGYVAPRREPGSTFRYLEMGSGQGLGLCILAAANPDGQFVGIDFNPAQIAHANELVRTTGLQNVRFVEADFLDLATAWPQDLGHFDYVVGHGIYSWIPPTARKAVVSCLKHATLPGALVYLSYNAMPGMATTLPFQHLARRLNEIRGRNDAGSVLEAVSLFEQMASSGTNIHQSLPYLAAKIDLIKTQDHTYLAHEYLNANWNPLWFSQVEAELSEAKLDYIGSATIAEHLLPAILPKEQARLITDQQNPVIRQEVQDCVIFQSFRRDLFCRGARHTYRKAPERVRNTPLVKVSDVPASGQQVQTSFAKITLRTEKYEPIMATLEAGAKSLDEITSSPRIQALGTEEAYRTIILLLNEGRIGISNGSHGNCNVAHAFNAAIARGASEGAPYGHVAAPLTGSGVKLSQIDLLLLDHWTSKPGCENRDLANGLGSRLTKLDQRLALKGKAIEGPALEVRLRQFAETFSNQVLPTMQRLGAVP